jgi:hypothetical protein
MLERKQRVIESRHESCISPAQVEPLMQSLLSTLADIDFEYQYEQRKLNCSTGDRAFKARMSHRLEHRHRERRRPYIEELNRLHARVQAAVEFERR